MSSDELYPSRSVFGNDQLNTISDVIELSTSELKKTGISPVYMLRYGSVELYARYRINVNHYCNNGFMDTKELESFKFFVIFMIKSMTSFNKRMTMLMGICRSQEEEEELNQPSGPKWIFCCYPFIWIVNYNRESHAYQPHSAINVVRKRNENGIVHDVYEDTINAYMLVHPGCERYDCDYQNLKISIPDSSLSHDDGELMPLSHSNVRVTRNGKTLPFLPYYEGRCLWCGGDLEGESLSDNPGENEVICLDMAEENATPAKKRPANHKNTKQRYYCSNSCKKRDQDYSKIFESKLESADITRVLSLYKSYLSENGRWGEQLTIEEIENQTADSIVTDYHMGTIPHIQVMSWIRGPCRECGKEIPLNKAMNVKYCSQECINKGRKKEWWRNHYKTSSSSKKDD